MIDLLLKQTKGPISKYSEKFLGFQATNLELAAKHLKKAVKEKYRIDLGFTSNLVTSGCRKFLKILGEKKIIETITTTAGGIEEDVIQEIDAPFINFKKREDDRNLYERGYFRSGNRVARSTGYVSLQTLLEKTLDKETGTIKTSSLINKISSGLEGYLSFFPKVFCPAIEDGAIGDYLFLRTRRKKELLKVSFTQDHVSFQQDLLSDSRKKVALLLGGSVPKHYILNSAILDGGYDYAIFLNTGIPYDGSNAGAEPSEAYSWGKVSKEGVAIKVFGDFTITFPLLLLKAGIITYSEYQK